MATLLFLLAWMGGRCNSPYDVYWGALLVALDANTVVRWWMFQRSGR